MLTKEEKEIIYFSLSMRAGFIETGDPCLRAVDARKIGKEIKCLSFDQKRGISMIENLMKRVLNGDIS